MKLSDLKGAPALVLLALNQDTRPQRAAWLAVATGYTEKVTRNALHTLESLGVATQTAGGWVLKPVEITGTGNNYRNFSEDGPVENTGLSEIDAPAEQETGKNYRNNRYKLPFPVETTALTTYTTTTPPSNKTSSSSTRRKKPPSFTPEQAEAQAEMVNQGISYQVADRLALIPGMSAAWVRDKAKDLRARHNGTYRAALLVHALRGEKPQEAHSGPRYRNGQFSDFIDN